MWCSPHTTKEASVDPLSLFSLLLLYDMTKRKALWDDPNAHTHMFSPNFLSFSMRVRPKDKKSPCNSWWHLVGITHTHSDFLCWFCYMFLIERKTFHSIAINWHRNSSRHQRVKPRLHYVGVWKYLVFSPLRPMNPVRAGHREIIQLHPPALK